MDRREFLRLGLTSGTVLVTRPAFTRTQTGKWRILGPGGGGAQFRPTISPHGGKQVLVACDMTGGYLSEDAGSTWRMFNLRGVSELFVFDPRDPNVLYARTIGLWRSVDRGRRWNLVYPAPAGVNGLDIASDHADETILVNGKPVPVMTALAIDPENSKTLYAAFLAGKDSCFRDSRDWGQTWSAPQSLPSRVRAIHVDGKTRAIYVVGQNSVSVLTSGEWNHGPQVTGVSKFADAASGAVSDSGKPVIYGVANSELWISTDGGASWNRGEIPGAPGDLRAVAASANHAEVAYVSYSKLREGGESFHGVARTNDQGRSWELVWKEGTSAAPNIHDAWVTKRFGASWGENPLSMGVSPVDPNVAFGGDFGRTLRTTDGGRTWHAVYSKELGDGGYQSTGLDVTNSYGIHFDPFNPKNIFASTTDIGLFGSQDGGESWKSASFGAPRKWLNTTYWMVFDPEVRGRAWAVMSGVHDLPRPKMWRRRSPKTFQGGVTISDDGGWNWRASNEGMDPAAATHILLDPRSPRDARVLYVAAFGQGVYKSVDGGVSWKLKNSGISGQEPFAWRLAQASDGTLYLVVARRSEDGSIGTPLDGALYRSSDGAESWTKVSLPAGVNGPNGLQVDPKNPSRLYLAAWARKKGTRGEGGGIFLSDDAGRTWRNVHSADQHVYDISIDPHDPKCLYAAGFESSAWRSTDAGKSWKRISGFNFKWGQRVIPDPHRPGFLYVTTYGGGIWHGPAEGDRSGKEDIATPVLAAGTVPK